MRLCVTRHGETDFNVQKRYTGSTDIPLNAKGVSQAEELASKLSNTQFDVIVSSSLLRAKQTAEIVNKSLNTPIVFMDEFQEICMGVYQGLTQKEAEEQYPETWTRLAKTWKKTGSKPVDDAPEGGETLRQFDARIAAGLAKLKAEYADCKVLLVCHGFAVQIIDRQLEGLDFSEMGTFILGNCEIAEYVV